MQHRLRQKVLRHCKKEPVRNGFAVYAQSKDADALCFQEICSSSKLIQNGPLPVKTQKRILYSADIWVKVELSFQIEATQRKKMRHREQNCEIHFTSSQTTR